MFRAVILALALVGATAFAPLASRPMRGQALNAGAVDTLKGLEGPGIPWGSDGVLIGKEESEIKGYDTFNKFADALAKSGVDTSSGEYTIYAPTDTACDLVNSPELTPDVVKYHITEGRVPKGSIAGDQMTLTGKAMTYKYFSRQTFLDDAVIGQVPQGAATGQSYPVDVAFDNGLIHTIAFVQNPAWTKVSGDAGLGGIN
mmetsp:Transcript_27502/g.47828  ORF Transcript_27502/g.47828 Transcript_27502/m.47828 type:complete len:201 (+) Transcript_27502:26-628(+)